MARPSIFDKDHAPYGRAAFCGDPGHWRAAFREAMGIDEARRRMKGKSPWETIGLKGPASFLEAKAAFKRSIKANHPDRGGDPEKARDIIAAWESLKEDCFLIGKSVNPA